jgi:transposase-like protein
LALKRRRYTPEFKLQVVREVEAGKTPAQAAREHHIHPTLIIKWRQKHLRYAEWALTGNGNPYTHAARIADLERMVSQLMREHTLQQKALLRLKTHSRDRTGPGGS